MGSVPLPRSAEPSPLLLQAGPPVSDVMALQNFLMNEVLLCFLAPIKDAKAESQGGFLLRLIRKHFAVCPPLSLPAIKLACYLELRSMEHAGAVFSSFIRAMMRARYIRAEHLIWLMPYPHSPCYHCRSPAPRKQCGSCGVKACNLACLQQSPTKHFPHCSHYPPARYADDLD